MKRLALAAVFCVAVAACNQLHLTEGNAYPCTFSDPPGKRDTPCLGTDVCGLNNVCIAFVNEGPRFEGGITVERLPAYAREGYVVNTTQLHPGVLNGQINGVARDVLQPQGALLIGSEGQLFLSNGSVLKSADATDFPFATSGDFSAPMLIKADAGALPSLDAFSSVVGIADSRLACAVRFENGTSVACAPGDLVKRVRGSLISPLDGVVPVQAIGPDKRAFKARLALPLTSPSLVRGDEFDVNGAVDVTMLNHEVLAATPVVLAGDGLWLGETDGGFEQVLQTPPGTFDEQSSLNLNFASTLLTASNEVRLSTWEVSVTPPPRKHTVSQAWADCRPCRAGGIRAVTPLPSAAGVGVEVLCASDAGVSLVLVTGSHAPTPSDACETQTLALPLDPSLLFGGTLAVANSQRGLAVGNSRGSVWAGESLSTLLPIALERVPLDVTTFGFSNDTTTLVAITDRYLAAFDPAPPSNGFRRIAASDFNAGNDLRFTAAVRGASGWGVLANGVVARATLNGVPTLDFGPRLVSPAGEAVLRSAGGEAYVSGDGGVLALFVTADDGLYFVGDPQADGAFGDSPGGTLDLTPQLQPEPSVPIRNIALERTPLGTNGTTRARGYLVTSRNVYEWVFANQRWTSKQLVLAGGEPVEVWFDTARSALGRVGYADGQIYTLPSGFQMTLPIPQDEAGATLKILDYENFGGWPVALTTTGLWAASWGVDGGVVQNHFDDGRSNRPMEWHRLTLPDGTAPWNTVNKGRLFVAQNLGTGSDAGSSGTYSLFVFLPDRVLKVAEYQRN